METKYKASLSRANAIITALLTLILIGGGFVGYEQNINDGFAAFVPFSPILILVVAYFFTVRHYSVSNETITVHRPLGLLNVVIDINDVEYARLCTREEMDGTIRVWGGSGFFGSFGYFRNSTFKTFKMYSCNNTNRIVISMKDARNKSVVLSPDDPAMADDINGKIITNK